jgi:hypothetical protein
MLQKDESTPSIQLIVFIISCPLKLGLNDLAAEFGFQRKSPTTP